MAFLLYDIYFQNNKWRLVREISLFGHNAIYDILGDKYKNNLYEPLRWHIKKDDFSSYFASKYLLVNPEVVIDLKPDQQRNVSLYLLTDAWGYSDNGWTPIMFRLEALYIDKIVDNPAEFKKEFTPPEDRDIIYTFTYLGGSVNKGNLTGKWTSPRPSSTNSVLLWPNALEYFICEIKKRDPGLVHCL